MNRRLYADFMFNRNYPNWACPTDEIADRALTHVDQVLAHVDQPC